LPEFKITRPPLSSNPIYATTPCWDHTRRRYFEIHASTPTDSTLELLEMIGELYSIEADIRGKPAAERLRVRQEKSKPLLIAFETKIKTRLATLSRKSELTGAINYSLNRWAELMLFCDDGQAEISNILAENALRCVSLGRNNAQRQITRSRSLPIDAVPVAGPVPSDFRSGELRIITGTPRTEEDGLVVDIDGS
jgi:hypothetical protein